MPLEKETLGEMVTTWAGEIPERGKTRDLQKGRHQSSEKTGRDLERAQGPKKALQSRAGGNR